jgi:A/G-specific adenine glycosylase
VTDTVTPAPLPDPTILADFRQTVVAYYQAHRRDLPWRRTHDPYRILVSEVMLQQTQVPRVLVKYEEFLDAFPTVGALAAAPLEAVLRVWQGLGYNRRARSLKQSAAIVAGELDGEFPRTVPELLRLPGVGPATAAAVAAFAYGEAHPFIETNIRAVYLHHFFSDRTDVSDREILPLVEATLDRADPRSWYYALMDYGVELKRTHPNPSRRSRHHTRQSPFSGSRRQLRAQVLRVVLDRPGVTAAEVASAPDEGRLFGGLSTAAAEEAQRVDENARVESVLAELVAEGFLREEAGRYVIA